MNIHKCKYCKSEIKDISRRLYCSNECSNQQKCSDQSDSRVKNKKEKQVACNCKWCGNTYFPERFFSSDRQKWCSHECRMEAYKQRVKDKYAEPKRQAKVCKGCGLLFFPSVSVRRCYCTRACQIEAKKAEWREETQKARDITTHICPACDKGFTPEKSLKQVYCSRRCREKIPKKMYKMLQTIYKRSGTDKEHDTYEALGYSAQDLAKHLETFPDWNRLKAGDWHLDHKFPVIAFLKEGITDPKIICGLENLQPLSAKDNIVKNDRYDESSFKFFVRAYIK